MVNDRTPILRRMLPLLPKTAVSARQTIFPDQRNIPNAGSQALPLPSRLAETEEELRAAQRLRYDVFVRELGGGGEMVDHEAGLEQ